MRTVESKELLDKYDVIVVGAGPAGLAVALNAVEEGKSVLIVESKTSLENPDNTHYNQLRQNIISGIDKLHANKCHILLGSEVSEIMLNEGCVTVKDQQPVFRHLILADGALHPTAKLLPEYFNFHKKRSNVAAIEKNRRVVALVGDALGNPYPKTVPFSLADTIEDAEAVKDLLKEKISVAKHNERMNVMLTERISRKSAAILRVSASVPTFKKSKQEDFAKFLSSSSSCCRKPK